MVTLNALVLCVKSLEERGTTFLLVSFKNQRILDEEGKREEGKKIAKERDYEEKVQDTKSYQKQDKMKEGENKEHP